MSMELSRVAPLPWRRRGLRSVRIPRVRVWGNFGVCPKVSFFQTICHQSTHGKERSLLFKLGAVASSCIISGFSEY